ncbi:MAG: hypothetical protein AAF770_00165 [Bacteroidota bacterium]
MPNLRNTINQYIGIAYQVITPNSNHKKKIRLLRKAAILHFIDTFNFNTGDLY